MKKIYTLLVLVIISLSFANPLLAQIRIENPISANTFAELLELITKAVAGIIGPIAVIMFIIAGIIFLTSAGKPEKVTTAKTCLLYAIIGTAIALGAGIISATITTILGV